MAKETGRSGHSLICPFVHRFDILSSGEENYLIACTLKSGHEYKDDWITPGKVYAAKLPSDMADLDRDGVMELVVLSLFHGDEVSVYKKTEDGYEKVYQYPEKAEFLHAIWSGKLSGKTVVVLGHRKGARRLFALLWDKCADKMMKYMAG